MFRNFEYCATPKLTVFRTATPAHVKWFILKRLSGPFCDPLSLIYCCFRQHGDKLLSAIPVCRIGSSETVSHDICQRNQNSVPFFFFFRKYP
jgi:hypothetical protein